MKCLVSTLVGNILSFLNTEAACHAILIGSMGMDAIEVLVEQGAVINV